MGAQMNANADKVRSSDQTLKISIDKSRDFPVATLGGELRVESGTVISEELHPMVADSGAVLVLDLSGITWVDSGGLSQLISLVTHARLAGSRVILVQPAKYVAGVLEVTQLDQWFEIADDVESAFDNASDKEKT